MLKKVIRRKRPRLYLDHVERDGRGDGHGGDGLQAEGFAVQSDREAHWIKVKKSPYSQMEGREELFEKHV